jgi:hypothetical protein
MKPPNRQPEKLPDPWLFDSEALLRELDRCRELTLQIPTNGDCNATHFGIQIAVNAQWTLRENLRYLLHLHREKQRAIRKQHEQSLSDALSKNNAAFAKNIVHLGQPQTPAIEKRKRSRAPISRSHNRANRVA